MEISVRFIGRTIAEVTVSSSETKLTVDVCNLNGLVDPDFIYNLKEVTEQLESHNQYLIDNENV